MAINTIPTNIGGIQIPFEQIAGPLANLFTTDKPQNYIYPMELGTDPSLCHAVQFSIYERETKLQSPASAIKTGLDSLSSAVKGFSPADVLSTINEQGLLDATINASAKIAENSPDALKLIRAGTYTTSAKGNPLANISLYMPDTLSVNFSSNYNQIGITENFGVAGVVANSLKDSFSSGGGGVSNLVGGPLGTYVGAQTAGIIGKKLGFGDATAGLIQQATGTVVNPQLQLLYEGIELRTFNLEFLFTPRSAKEADNIKKIVDSFIYFSVPGVAGVAGNSGQFLTPPQVFKIKFVFTGGQGLSSTIGNIWQSAMSNIGLGFLNTTNPTGTISNSQNAKIYTIDNDCVLKDVTVDYAPNGWAAYNDGNPVQTRLTLTFQETQIITKQSISKGMTGNQAVDRYDYVKAYTSSGFTENSDGSWTVPKNQGW